MNWEKWGLSFFAAIGALLIAKDYAVSVESQWGMVFVAGFLTACGVYELEGWVKEKQKEKERKSK